MWWNNNTSENIEILYEKDIILGYLRDNKKYKVLNCCILVGKSMIHKQKSKEKHPDIYIFHCELKEFLAVETHILFNSNQVDEFEKEWGEILNI
jgi:hypothetical protein